MCPKPKLNKYMNKNSVAVKSHQYTLNRTIYKSFWKNYETYNNTEAMNGGVLGNNCSYLPADKLFTFFCEEK